VLWNFMELYGTLRLGEKFRNFMELFNVSYGTEQLWQFQYIVALANCNKASIEKSSADSLARNKM